MISYKWIDQEKHKQLQYSVQTLWKTKTFKFCSLKQCKSCQANFIELSIQLFIDQFCDKITVLHSSLKINGATSYSLKQFSSFINLR